MPEPRRRFVLTGGKFLAAPQRGVRRLRTAGTLRCPPRGQKGRDTCGFPSSLNSYLSLIRTARRQSESGDRFGIGERQSGYSCVGTRITRPLLDLYAVLRCRSATHTGNSTQTRHKVNCPKGKRRSPGGYPCRATLWHVVTEGTCGFRYSLQFIFVGPVYHNTLTNCAALLSPRGPSLALRAIHLVPHPA